MSVLIVQSTHSYDLYDNSDKSERQLQTPHTHPALGPAPPSDSLHPHPPKG